MGDRFGRMTDGVRGVRLCKSLSAAYEPGNRAGLFSRRNFWNILHGSTSIQLAIIVWHYTIIVSIMPIQCLYNTQTKMASQNGH